MNNIAFGSKHAPTSSEDPGANQGSSELERRVSMSGTREYAPILPRDPRPGSDSALWSSGHVRTGRRATSWRLRLLSRHFNADVSEESFTDEARLCRLLPMTLPGLDELPATFTYQQAIDAGLTHHRLYGLRDSGELEQVGRGLYRKAAAELTDLDLLEAAQRAPHATICLLSALARHDLTDTIPARYDVALPRNAWHPRLGPVIHWHSFDPATFDIGRTIVPVDDVTTIGLYDAPRTIVDSYRLRNMLGSEVAHEALRRWLRTGGQPAKLITVARAFPRAMPALMNALEVLL